MGEFQVTTDFILMLLPLIALQIGLAAYCIVKICKEGVRNLNKWAWMAICLFVSTIGPVVFLLMGRKRVA